MANKVTFLRPWSNAILSVFSMMQNGYNRDEHGHYIDVTDPFKKRTSARIDFGFTGSINDNEVPESNK